MFSAGELPKRDQGRRPAPAHARHRRLRVERASCQRTQHPQAVNPSNGRLRELEQRARRRGWGAADDNWSYGSLHRVSLLNGQLARHAEARPRLGDGVDERGRDAGPAQRRADADAAEAAARRRAAERRAPSAMLALLEAWNAGGSSRLDVDQDGDDGRGPGARDLGRALPAAARRRHGRPRSARSSTSSRRSRATTTPRGSGFTGGGINYVDKDLRTLLGTKFKHPFSTRFCGERRASRRAAPRSGRRSTRPARRSRRARAPSRPDRGSRTPTPSGSSSRPAS